MNTDVRAWAAEPENVLEEETAEEIKELPDNWWRRVSRWTLYGIVFAAPLLFLPTAVPPTLIKQVVVSGFAFIAFIAWLGELLLSGRVFYKRSLINAALLLLLIVLFSSTLFSPQALNNLISSDSVGEKFISFLVFALIYFVAASAMRETGESNAFAGWLLLGGALLSLISLFQFFSPGWVPIAALARADVNTIGTANALAAVLGFYFVLLMGIITGSGGHFRKLTRVLLVGFLITVFLNLLIINFHSVWIAIAASLIVLLGFKIGFSRGDYAFRMATERGNFSFLFLALAVSIFLILSRVSPLRISSIPAEISPSYKATLDIARSTLKDSLWFGSGPGTFGLDYSLHRSPLINQTNFWGVRFNSGAAFLPTALATTGVLGVGALILFSLVSLVSLFRQVAKEGAADPVLAGSAAGVAFGLLMWWLYTSTFALQVILFAVLGLSAARLSEKISDSARFSRWRIAGRSIQFGAPWATFTVSLVVIFLMVAGISLLYYSVQQYISAVHFTRGSDSFSGGNADLALERIGRAITLASANDQYYRARAEVFLFRVQNIVNQASASANPNLRVEFQANASGAIEAARRATEISAADSLNWTTLGVVYQALVPFLQGAEGEAIKAYDKALQHDPHNPSYEFSKAGAYMALADRLQLLLGQVGQDQNTRASLGTQRTETLAKARASLERSLQQKPDYAQANYLLAQVLLRQGNTGEAIRQVEAVRQLAPFDIGIAFQLGVLYYQSEELEKARAEFERAVGVNENYSNARYFLGLIYDRQGDKAAAVSEFERIEALNPDNQEVKAILENLSSGKAALAGISPPAPSPGKRSEPPLKDSGKP